MTDILQLPVFTVDSWSANQIDDDGVEWWMTSEQGWSSTPPVRLSLTERPQRDGTFDAPTFRSARVITIEGTAIAPDPVSRERAKNRLAAVLADGSLLAELVVQDRLLVRRMAVRQSAETKIVDTTADTFTWSVQMTAPDPLRYAAAVRTAQCGLPLPGAGLSFPVRGWPLDFGERRDGALVLDNEGTATTWPVWTITGPCAQPIIRDTRTGGSLSFGLSLLAGDTLVVDAAARTIRLNRASRRSALLRGSTWFGIPPGGTTVEFDALRTDVPGLLSASWRDAWL